MGARALRRLAEARPVRVVEAPDGTPRALVHGGRRRLVVSVRDEWLVQDRWWTDAPVDRRYFELVLEPGRPVVAYRERGGAWYAHLG
jgi:hypothetical protein